jgi:hypothetical protein
LVRDWPRYASDCGVAARRATPKPPNALPTSLPTSISPLPIDAQQAVVSLNPKTKLLGDPEARNVIR